MNLIKNKRAEKLYSLVWIVSFLLIGTIVIYSTVSYYNQPFDTREYHSQTLTHSVFDCFVENGFLKKEILSDFNFQENCKINEKVLFENDLFFVSINISDYENKEIKYLEKGSTKFKADCVVSEEINTKNYPNCYLRNFPVFYLDENGTVFEYKIKILASSNNLGKRISINNLGGENE